ncbi:hypothetical protein SEA_PAULODIABOLI_349 [Microbacterium phage PauloDiaboli]|nr:hypothetical protein SEA_PAULODIABOLI_349 [Microbacterium phage PauloDiaboli]QWY84156.1 hypothetical protein SEA_A3WALLY_349 [Microbacterium phage A3Wally]
MIERCARCGHDRRNHHKVGGCNDRTFIRVGEIRVCSCPSFALTKGEVYGTL